jgi:hypothetical protein
MPATLAYGNFPHLFWDLDPSAQVNIRNVVVFRRVLERGTTTDIRRLVDPEAALATLTGLELPEHLHRFWQTVFERAAALPR